MFGDSRVWLSTVGGGGEPCLQLTNFLTYYSTKELVLARDLDAIANGMEGTVRHVASKVRKSRFYFLERVCKLLEVGPLTLRQRMFVNLRESC